jgi:DNA segregation ATPase FtsK/SpoIIIE, S-DNA-T family
MTTPSTPDQPESRAPDPAAEVVFLDAARADRTASSHADAPPADVPVLEGEIVRVDQPGGAPGDWLADLAARSKDRRPIIPVWLRSRREALTTLKWVSGHYLHVGGYHATRVPKYGAKLTVRTPRGLARVAAGMTRWMLDLEGHPVRMAAVLRADPEAYLKLSRQRDARVRLRVWIAGLALLAVLAVAAVAVIGPPVARWAAVALAVVVFGTLGGPADRPLIDRAVAVFAGEADQRHRDPRPGRAGHCRHQPGRRPRRSHRDRVQGPDRPGRPELARGCGPALRRDCR